MNKNEQRVVDKLMAAAKSLFCRFGIRRVSVAEICREAGVSKMSFYRHFRDKGEMAVKVLGKHFTERMENFEAILLEDIPFEEKLRKTVAIKMAWFKNVGNELIRDVMSDRESAPGKFLVELLNGQARRTKEIFVNLQKRGDIRKDIRVELIMHVVEGLWKAFGDETLLGLYDDKSQLYEELCKAAYYGILPPKKKKTWR